MQTTLIIPVTQNITLFFTHHLWCFEHAWRLEVSAVKKQNKFKIVGGLFNSLKNNQNLIICHIRNSVKLCLPYIWFNNLKKHTERSQEGQLTLV